MVASGKERGLAPYSAASKLPFFFLFLYRPLIISVMKVTMVWCDEEERQGL